MATTRVTNALIEEVCKARYPGLDPQEFAVGHGGRRTTARVWLNAALPIIREAVIREAAFAVAEVADFDSRVAADALMRAVAAVMDLSEVD